MKRLWHVIDDNFKEYSKIAGVRLGSVGEKLYFMSLECTLYETEMLWPVDMKLNLVSNVVFARTSSDNNSVELNMIGVVLRQNAKKSILGDEEMVFGNSDFTFVIGIFVVLSFRFCIEFVLAKEVYTVYGYMVAAISV